MLKLDDTIAGIATAPGLGAVAIVRVSGPRARQVCETLVRSWPPPREAALRRLRDGSGEILDRALVLWFPGPESFTGEDQVELHTHGGQVVPARVLRTLVEAGARLAEPGEFSRRAFLNGKKTLDEVEAMNDLVHARDEGFATQALRQMQGGLARRIEALRARLIDLAALLEASLDYPEDDVPELDVPSLLEEVAGIREEVAGLAASWERGRLLREGIPVVLTGRPNVGKSSLLNALLREERAIVTPEAGTTRDVLEEGLHHGGLRYRLMDTAGLRETGSQAEGIGVERARAVAGEASVRLVVTVAGEPLDGELDPARDLLVRNKVDLVGREDDPVEVPEGVAVFWVSALESMGVEALMEGIHERAGGVVAAPEEDLVVTNLRHRTALEAAGAELEAFGVALAGHVPYDLSLTHLYAATRELGLIVGAVGVEDVLDRIFERFCLGK